jgi:hypothetical protein
MATFFVIFYFDDACLASRNPDFLRRVLDIIAGLFARICLETNTQKTQTMICTPGRIRIQLLEDSYAWMRGGMTLAGEWESGMVICCQCNALVQTSSLQGHSAEQHGTYQAVVVQTTLSHKRACNIKRTPSTMARSLTLCRSALVSLGMDGCSVATFGTSTLLIR